MTNIDPYVPTAGDYETCIKVGEYHRDRALYDFLPSILPDDVNATNFMIGVGFPIIDAATDHVNEMLDGYDIDTDHARTLLFYTFMALGTMAIHQHLDNSVG